MSLSSRRRTDALVVVAALLALVWSGCGAGADDGGEAAPDPEVLYFEPLGYGQRASISDTLETVFRTEEEWGTYRDSLQPVAPFGPIDFSQVDVLLVALPQPTSGHALEFVSVDRLDSLIVAEYVVQVPSDDCLTAYAETVPFQVVLVRKTGLPVRFVRSEEEYRCTFGPRRM